jgi:hypothetical protein
MAKRASNDQKKQNMKADDDLDDIDFNNYKGIYINEQPGTKFQDTETGAHFDYDDMCRRLVKIRELTSKRDLLEANVETYTNSKTNHHQNESHHLDGKVQHQHVTEKKRELTNASMNEKQSHNYSSHNRKGKQTKSIDSKTKESQGFDQKYYSFITEKLKETEGVNNKLLSELKEGLKASQAMAQKMLQQSNQFKNKNTEPAKTYYKKPKTAENKSGSISQNKSTSNSRIIQHLAKKSSDRNRKGLFSALTSHDVFTNGNKENNYDKKLLENNSAYLFNNIFISPFL